jgi:hypothetical protein
MNCLINYLLHPISYFQNCTYCIFFFQIFGQKSQQDTFSIKRKKRGPLFSPCTVWYKKSPIYPLFSLILQDGFEAPIYLLQCLIKEAPYLPYVQSDTRSSLSTLCTVWYKKLPIYPLYCLIQEVPYLPSVLSDTRSPLSTLCTVWYKKSPIYSLYCLIQEVPYLLSVLSDTRSPLSTLCTVW